jgi:hypothetical protein
MVAMLDTPYISFEIKESILIASYKKGLKINLDIAKEIVNRRLVFTNQQTVPVMILNQGVVSIEKEARDFLSSTDGIRGVKAAAIVLKTPFGSFLGNFLISVTKPAIPAKIFSTEEAAMQWLKKFV